MAVDREAVADALAQANARTGLFRTGWDEPGAGSPGRPERAAGFYWVRLDGYPIEVGQWRDGGWWLAGEKYPFRPDVVTVLSPRLTPPGEPGTEQPAVRIRWGVPVGGDAT